LGSISFIAEPAPVHVRLGAKTNLHEICARLVKTSNPHSLGDSSGGSPSFEDTDTYSEKPFFVQPIHISGNLLKNFDDVPLTCRYCGKAFTATSTLEIHERFCVREKPPPFKCIMCDKVFERKCNFTRHKCSLVEERPHKCKHCEKTFVRPSHLACHELIHTGEKPYKCKYCEKGFTEKPNLARHELIHTGEKPFECKSCL
jgi:KRAB domain-containing zinc finger protein